MHRERERERESERNSGGVAPSMNDQNVRLLRLGAIFPAFCFPFRLGWQPKILPNGWSEAGNAHPLVGYAEKQKRTGSFEDG